MALDSNTLLLVLSVILAFGSVLGVALPLIHRAETKEKTKAIIQQRRRDLLQEVRTENLIQKDDEKTLSSKDSIALLFKMRKLAGGKDDVRNLMLQAGYRSPKAPIVYMIARLILPLFLCAFAFLIIGQMEEAPHDSLTLMVIFLAFVAGYFLPRVIVKNQAMKRQQEIAITFPDALDMILICVQGGIGIEAAINRVTDAVHDLSETLAEELGILAAELSMLNDRKGAFRGFADRVGSGAARTFANAMIQAEQYGTSISQAMRVLAEELRHMRMGEAERKAASLPPKLTVPMILFFLPVLFVVILAPAVLSALKL